MFVLVFDGAGEGILNDAKMLAMVSKLKKGPSAP